jgi:hypothetical protein
MFDYTHKFKIGSKSSIKKMCLASYVIRELQIEITMNVTMHLLALADIWSTVTTFW